MVELCSGYTALHFVCGGGETEAQVEIIELLLGVGADTTILDARGKTAEDLLREQQWDSEADSALFAQVPDSDGPRCWCMPGGW